MTTADRVARFAALGLLAVSAAAPFVLLAIWSVGRDWFYPAVFPPRFTAQSWRDLLSGERLLGATTTSLVLGAGTGAFACIAGLPVGRSLA
ncbi:MAG: hypothetical protein H0V43_06205, partial [Gemmatimonadales bacterium]|nr:hypothetical protein [Gemmatimonadales bacterium]